MLLQKRGPFLLQTDSTVREFQERQVIEFNSKRFPTKSDVVPTKTNYRTYHRAE